MKNKSQLSIYLIIYSSIAILLLSGLLIWINYFITSTVREVYKKRLFAIAEAGVEYYRWHLNHAPRYKYS